MTGMNYQFSATLPLEFVSVFLPVSQSQVSFCSGPDLSEWLPDPQNIFEVIYLFAANE